MGLMRPLAYCDAKEIKDAVSVRLGDPAILGAAGGQGYSVLSPRVPQGAGTDEKCLIEILASRTNQQIHELVAAYKDGACGVHREGQQLFFCPSVCPSLCPALCPSVCPSFCPPSYLLFLCPPAFPSILPFITVSIHLSLHLSLSL